MKRLLVLMICAAAVLTVCGKTDVGHYKGASGSSTTICWSEPPASSWSVNENITVSLAQDTFPVGWENFTVTFTNTGKETMLYGESYLFQHNDGSGWEDLETIENYGFNMIAYLLLPGETQTLDVRPWMLTEPLSDGRYRIVGCSLQVAATEDQLTSGGNYREFDPYVLEFDIVSSASDPTETAASNGSA